MCPFRTQLAASSIQNKQGLLLVFQLAHMISLLLPCVLPASKGMQGSSYDLGFGWKLYKSIAIGMFPID